MTIERDRVILITGANTGIGYGLCERFLAEQSPSSPHLHLILGCRNTQRAQRAIDNLMRSYQKCASNTTLTHLSLDLCDTSSIQRAIETLHNQLTHLDVFYANAGVLSVSGIDWMSGIQMFLTEPSRCFTDVSGILTQRVGQLTKGGYGLVFMANLFGHYLMIRGCEDLLSKSGKGKIVWTSSQTSTPSAFSFSDFQALETTHAYESSKYLSDLTSMALNREYKERGIGVRSYVADPGVVFSGILGGVVPWFVEWLTVAPVLFIASLLVSSVVLTAWRGATSLYYLSGVPGAQGKLDIVDDASKEQDETMKRYSSASRNFFGETFVHARALFEDDGVQVKRVRGDSELVLARLKEMHARLKQQ